MEEKKKKKKKWNDAGKRQNKKKMYTQWWREIDTTECRINLQVSRLFDVDGALNSLHVYYIFCRETIEMGKCVFLMDKTDKMGSYGDNFYFSRRLCATILGYHVGDNINIYNKDLDKFSFRRMK